MVRDLKVTKKMAFEEILHDAAYRPRNSTTAPDEKSDRHRPANDETRNYPHERGPSLKGSRATRRRHPERASPVTAPASELNLQDYLQSYIQVSVCGGRRRPAAPRSRALCACGRVPRHTLPRSSQREGQEVESGRRSAALGLPFLLRLELLAEDRRDLTLHESPWHRRVCQRAFFSTWTVNLKDNSK